MATAFRYSAICLIYKMTEILDFTCPTFHLANCTHLSLYLLDHDLKCKIVRKLHTCSVTYIDIS